jgi:hypothetical protein
MAESITTAGLDRALELISKSREQISYHTEKLKNPEISQIRREFFIGEIDFHSNRIEEQLKIVKQFISQTDRELKGEIEIETGADIRDEEGLKLEERGEFIHYGDRMFRIVRTDEIHVTIEVHKILFHTYEKVNVSDFTTLKDWIVSNF